MILLNPIKHAIREARAVYSDNNAAMEAIDYVSSSFSLICGPIVSAPGTARKAAELWGARTQTDIAIGEIGELLTMIGRHAQGRDTEDEWTDEIADVYICMLYLVQRFSSDENVLRRIEEKLHRLELRVYASPQNEAAP